MFKIKTRNEFAKIDLKQKQNTRRSDTATFFKYSCNKKVALYRNGAIQMGSAVEKKFPRKIFHRCPLTFEASKHLRLARHQNPRTRKIYDGPKISRNLQTKLKVLPSFPLAPSIEKLKFCAKTKIFVFLLENGKE